jgi:cob(I)alamin adenosyltransferase
MNTQKRLIHVYTGNGKGKTTAALGLAMRACGHGWKVLMVQFLKGEPDAGEIRTAPKITSFELIQYGQTSMVDRSKPDDHDIQIAREGFEFAQKAILQERYDLVILDEINVAVDFRLIPLEKVIQLLQNKPDCVEVVLTGRNVHPDVIELADVVSEMREIKHPFRKGLQAREGIEY